MKKILYVLLLTSAFCACTDILHDDISGTNELVPVNINFSAEKVFRTKGESGEGEAGTEKDLTAYIKNMWIIQFDGNGDNARILGSPTYISDFSQFDGKVRLMTTDRPGRVCFIANTFEGVNDFPINQWSTLSDLRSKYKLVNDQNDLLGAIIDGAEYFIYYGEISAEVNSSTQELSPILHKNIAKATFKVATDVTGLTIKSMQVCSVPSISHYAVDGTKTGLFPSTTSFNRINYPVVLSDDGAGHSFSTYLPVNLRGISDSDESKDKAKYAPYAATYLLVSALYEDKQITYTFYLGDNPTNDYNIAAGYHYKYDFMIKEVGDSDSDSRVEFWDNVDFTDTRKYDAANSYILNPMPAGCGMRRFRIPISQIAAFWGNNGYENDSRHSDAASFDCVIMASDFELDDNKFRIVKSKINASEGFFEVEVAPGMEGNVIIGVGTSVGGSFTASWSWHLWITDYNPYSCFEFGDGIVGQYVYPVSGGYVHRYADDPSKSPTYWGKDANARQYMMDRNIGSFSDEKFPVDTRGLLYYQYGRKDPFFFEDSYKYLINQSSLTPPSETYNNIKEYGAVKYSVINPLEMIIGNQRWTEEEKYIGKSGTYNTISWNDKHATEGKKSIFDPCPPGFKVPSEDVWNGFLAQGTAYPTTNAYGNSEVIDGNTIYSRGFKSFKDASGLRYWPYDENDVPEYPGIYYPASGYKERNDVTTVNYLWTESLLSCTWSETASSKTSPLVKVWRFGPAVIQNTGMNRACALPVRCITDQTSVMYPEQKGIDNLYNSEGQW